MAEHNDIGKKGEDLTVSFLMKQGFSILERNFHVREGELDIVAEKDKTLHCVEVKTIKVRDCSSIENLRIRPEDNLTQEKYRKLRITFEMFKKSRNVASETREQIDLACVYLDTERRQARIKILHNVQLE